MILLDVVFFATEDARWFDVLDDYVTGANYQLASFDLKLACTPKRPDYPPYTLPLKGKFQDRSGDPGRLREACHRALPVGRGVPVIFCSFSRSDAGVTIDKGDKDANGQFDWLPYVMINTDTKNSQLEVLAHELVHAAGYTGDIDNFGGKFLHDSDPKSIMSLTSSRGKETMVSLQEKHAIHLRKAYFARAA